MSEQSPKVEPPKVSEVDACKKALDKATDAYNALARKCTDAATALRKAAVASERRVQELVKAEIAKDKATLDALMKQKGDASRAKDAAEEALKLARRKAEVK